MGPVMGDVPRTAGSAVGFFDVDELRPEAGLRVVVVVERAELWLDPTWPITLRA